MRTLFKVEKLNRHDDAYAKCPIVDRKGIARPSDKFGRARGKKDECKLIPDRDICHGSCSHVVGGTTKGVRRSVFQLSFDYVSISTCS